MNGPFSYVCSLYMPFGVQSASQFFALWIRDLYEKLPIKLQRHILYYLDDLLVHSTCLQKHFEVLSELFAILSAILSAAHVVLQTSKCSLFCTKIEYLGFTVSEGRIEVKGSYLGKIKSWQAPHDLKSLEQFLGFCAYYSSFVKSFAESAFVLSELRKNVRNMGNSMSGSIWKSQK